jgi:hypothetical protein
VGDRQQVDSEAAMAPPRLWAMDGIEGEEEECCVEQEEFDELMGVRNRRWGHERKKIDARSPWSRQRRRRRRGHVTPPSYRATGRAVGGHPSLKHSCFFLFFMMECPLIYTINSVWDF